MEKLNVDRIVLLPDCEKRGLYTQFLLMINVLSFFYDKIHSEKEW